MLPLHCVSRECLYCYFVKMWDFLWLFRFWWVLNDFLHSGPISEWLLWCSFKWPEQVWSLVRLSCTFECLFRASLGFVTLRTVKWFSLWMGYVTYFEIDCLCEIVFTLFTLKFFSSSMSISSKHILSWITFHKGANLKEPFEDDQWTLLLDP